MAATPKLTVRTEAGNPPILYCSWAIAKAFTLLRIFSASSTASSLIVAASPLGRR